VDESPLLELRSLSVTYGGVQALDSISLRVPQGGAVSLLGPNGAGKTTVLRAVSGLLGFHGGRVTSGEVRFDGESVTGSFAFKLVRRGVAQVLEGRHVFADLTVEENLRAGAFCVAERHRVSGRLEEMVELFPVLGERRRQPAGLLSGGEQQMLAIARALMGEPRLLMLDEPSLGLAPLVVRSIGEALRTVHESGVAILLVEQSSALATAVTDEAYLLETGRVRASAPTRELLADSSVREVYLGVQAAP